MLQRSYVLKKWRNTFLSNKNEQWTHLFHLHEPWYTGWDKTLNEKQINKQKWPWMGRSAGDTWLSNVDISSLHEIYKFIFSNREIFNLEKENIWHLEERIKLFCVQRGVEIGISLFIMVLYVKRKIQKQKLKYFQIYTLT